MRKLITLLTFALLANMLMVDEMYANMAPKVRVVVRNNAGGSAGIGGSSGWYTDTEVTAGCAWTDEDGMPSNYTPKPFSVGGGKKVFFSQGNLEYRASTNEWIIPDHQWEGIENHSDAGLYRNRTVAGRLYCSNDDISITNENLIDLFSWGTSGWNSGANRFMPYENGCYGKLDLITDFTPGGDMNNDLTGDYAQADWGSAVSDDNHKYRTLTKDEWDFVLNKRENASSLHKYGKLNCIYKGAESDPEGITYVEGLFLFPDNYKGPNNIDWKPLEYDEWAAMEKEGAIFLPVCGFVTHEVKEVVVSTSKYGGGTTEEVLHEKIYTDKVRYWTSSHKSEEKAYAVSFAPASTPSVVGQYRNNRCSVRLVSDCYVLAGKGTPDDPYLINDYNDLDLIRSEISSGNSSVCFKLMNDIDLSNVNWEPLSNSILTPFYGTFDGNGHSINLNSETGLFTCLADNATIKNLTVSGKISTNGNITQMTGAICRLIVISTPSTVTIENVVSNVDIYSAVTFQSTYLGAIGGLVGGIISGTNDNAVVFKNCTNNGNILLPDATGSINNVGGLIGTSFDSNFAVNIQYTNTNFNGSILIGEQTATSIQKTSVDCDNVSIYDLSGRKLNKPKKGINIINGKKVLIK